MMLSSSQVEVGGTIPLARFGPTVTQISPSKIMVFGGATGTPLNYIFTNDTFTFEIQKRLWKKITPNKSTPSPRAAHAAVAIDTNQVMIYGGAASSAGQMADVGLYFLRLQQNTGQWRRLQVTGQTPGKRYGHVLIFAKSNIILFGGHTQKHEANDLWILNIQNVPLGWTQINPKGVPPSPRVYHSAAYCTSGSTQGMILMFGGRSDKKAQYDLWGLTKHRDNTWSWQEAPVKDNSNLIGRYQHSSHCLGTSFIVAGGRTNSNDINLTVDVFDTQTNEWKSFPTSVQRFRHGSWISDQHLYIYAGFQKQTPTIPTDIIKRIKLDFKPQPKIPQYFVDYLLQPQNYRTCQGMKFIFKPSQIITLCDMVQKIIMDQPVVLKVKAPVQVFGDIHGQYSDLMSFFALYGTPYANGKPKDIQNFDYVFLGDYVDRGSHSLQTICLLFALKCMYPNQIHLIRGNHQDIQTNETFGFAEECQTKCNQDALAQGSVFKRINQVFDQMPLAAVIQQKILCLHGGIGSKLRKVEEINKIKRPINIVHAPETHQDQLILDILWSDPTQKDDIIGIHPNPPRDPDGLGNIVKFGPDVVRRFLKQNNLDLIIRAHECVMDGFQRFAGGELITLFSATDYCRKHKNSGAMLTIKTNMQIIPKLIHPSSQNANNWIQDQHARPSTPPRWRHPNLKN